MADWPLEGGQRWFGTGAQSTITPNASAHTKGSYTALFTAAGNTQYSVGMLLGVRVQPAAASPDYLLDVAYGAAASEQVVLSNFLISLGETTGLISEPWIYLPIAVPSGQRIAARCQCSAASGNALLVHARLLSQGFKPGSPLARIASYGPDTSTTRGVSVDPGGSANTKGAYSEITSSTTFGHSAILPVVGLQQNTARSGGDFALDIAVGGSGSENIVVADLRFTLSGLNAVFPLPALPLQVPEGTRISARASCSITDATDRLLDVAVYGIG